MEKILFYLGHPAHFHLFKNVIKKLPEEKYNVAIKSKDVLESLLQEHNIKYINVDSSTASKKNKTNFTIAGGFGKRLLKLGAIINRTKSKILAGSAAELAVLGRLTAGTTSCIFFEDDFEKVAKFANIAGPLAHHLVCPDVCSAWKWNHKKTGYNSYHELAYLHPDHFIPSRQKIEKIFDLSKRNFIIRFSDLGAYHDFGKTGMTDDIALQVISLLLPHGNVHITSERTLPDKFEKYRITLKASDIHHALYFADLFIGDSQTMTAEAAVLGTPAIRFNDFAGELSYLEDLEHTFDLTYGIRTQNQHAFFEKIRQLLAINSIKTEWRYRKEKMLASKCNFSEWMYNFLESIR